MIHPSISCEGRRSTRAPDSPETAHCVQQQAGSISILIILRHRAEHGVQSYTLAACGCMLYQGRYLPNALKLPRQTRMHMRYGTGTETH